MKYVRRASAALLTFLLCVQSLAAQQTHVADLQALNNAIATHRANEEADRQMVLGVLGRPEVRQEADRIGLSPERAQSAVKTLTGAELQDVVNEARKADAALAGGASVTLQTTTIIIILLVVILIIVAVK